MGIAEKIYEVVRGLPEPQAVESLGFAEHVKSRVTRRHGPPPADALMWHCSVPIAAGTMEEKLNREEHYNRAGLR